MFWKKKTFIENDDFLKNLKNFPTIYHYFVNESV